VASPLNTIAEMLLLSPWKLGDGSNPDGSTMTPVDILDAGEFTEAELEAALQLARDQLDSLLRGADVTTLDAFRLPRIKRAEALLCYSILAETYALRTGVQVPPNKTAAVGGVSMMEYDPSREERKRIWKEEAANLRTEALALLKENVIWAVQRFEVGYDDSVLFPFEQSIVGQTLSESTIW